MLQIKSLKLESSDWNTIGHKSQASRTDDGFEAVFNTIRQDFTETAKAAAPQRNAEGQRRIDEVKPDRCAKKENPSSETENEIEVRDPSENDQMEIAEAQPDSPAVPVESEEPVEEPAEPVDPDPDSDLQATGDSSEDVSSQEILVNSAPAAKEVEMLLRLAGQANAKTTRQQIAGLNPSPQPVLTAPENAPKTDAVQNLAVNGAAETDPMMEMPADSQAAPASTEEEDTPVVPLIKEQVILSGSKGNPEAKPVEEEKPQKEIKQTQPAQPIAKPAAGEEKGRQEAGTSFHSDSRDSQSSQSQSQAVEMKTALADEEVAQPVIAQPVLRSSEPEKKLHASVEVVSADTAKTPLADKGNSVQKIFAASTSVNTTPVEMKDNIDQLIKSVQVTQAQGGSRVQLRLDPPELGALRIEMRQTENGLLLQLQASTPRAQQLLQQNSGELRAALESQGFQNTQIEVQLRMDLRNDSTSQEYREMEQEQEQLLNQQPGQFDSPQQGGNGEQAGWQPDRDRVSEESPAQPEYDTDENTMVPQNEWQELAFASLDIRA